MVVVAEGGGGGGGGVRKVDGRTFYLDEGIMEVEGHVCMYA